MIGFQLINFRDPTIEATIHFGFSQLRIFYYHTISLAVTETRFAAICFSGVPGMTPCPLTIALLQDRQLIELQFRLLQFIRRQPSLPNEMKHAFWLQLSPSKLYHGSSSLIYAPLHPVSSFS